MYKYPYLHIDFVASFYSLRPLSYPFIPALNLSIYSFPSEFYIFPQSPFFHHVIYRANLKLRHASTSTSRNLYISSFTSLWCFKLEQQWSLPALQHPRIWSRYGDSTPSRGRSRGYAAKTPCGPYVWAREDWPTDACCSYEASCVRRNGYRSHGAIWASNEICRLPWTGWAFISHIQIESRPRPSSQGLELRQRSRRDQVSVNH